MVKNRAVTDPKDIVEEIGKLKTALKDLRNLTYDKSTKREMRDMYEDARTEYEDMKELIKLEKESKKDKESKKKAVIGEEGKKEEPEEPEELEELKKEGPEEEEIEDDDDRLTAITEKKVDLLNEPYIYDDYRIVARYVPINKGAKVVDHIKSPITFPEAEKALNRYLTSPSIKTPINNRILKGREFVLYWLNYNYSHQ